MSDVIEEGGGEETSTELSPELLAEAADLGWCPLEKWQGKPEEWRDAPEFVRRGREIQPILRNALKKERERTAALEERLKAQGATVAELREYLSKVEERATKNAMASLKKAQRDALEAGDHAAAAEYSDQMDELKDSPSAVPKATAQAQPQQMHPEVASWMHANPWYSEENPEMLEYANGVAATLMQRRAGTAFTPGDILPEVTAKVQRMFPKHFSRGEEPPASMFESGGTSTGSARAAGTGTGKRSGFDAIPREAQSQFKRFYEAGYYVELKTGKKLDLAAAKAEYLKEYER
jgi:hypothetical protein